MGEKYIALSFDDGPCASSDNGGTRALLAVLEDLKVKATFFVIGQNVRRCPDETAAIFKAGHEIANHSDDHALLGDKDGAFIEGNIDAASRAITEITGSRPALFRAPCLNHGQALSRVCKEKGLPLIDGTCHNDWPGSGGEILESVLNNTKDGDIIVLHENNTSKGNTLSVLPGIIGGLRERGFSVLTVGELARVKGVSLEAGERYQNMV
jgi:peptidoglycan/xylan/chitin deacetylase (PgdA/CDA1 family)